MNLFKKAQGAQNTIGVKNTKEVKRRIEATTASKEIEKQLGTMTNAQWSTLLNHLERFVETRLHGRTQYGAHTIHFLGEDPHDYYVMNSITKVLTMERKWDFKIFSLEDQLKRIVGSMISKNVERYKHRQVHFLNEDESTLEYLAFTYANEEVDSEFLTDREVQHHILQQASHIIFDKLEKKIYTLVYTNRLNSREIADLLGMEIKEVQTIRHNAKRRLKRFMLKRFNDYKKNTTDNYDYETSI